MKYLIEIIIKKNKPYIITDEKGNRFTQEFPTSFLVNTVIELNEPETNSNKEENEMQETKKEIQEMQEQETKDFQEDTNIKQGLTKEDFQRIAKQKVKDNLPPGFKKKEG